MIELVKKEESGTNKKTLLIIGVSISLIIIMILVANPSDLGENIAGADLLILSVVIFLYVINIFLKSGRWYFLLRAAGTPVSFSNCILYFCIGQAFNNAIPGRVAGEATKIYTLRSHEGVNAGSGLATIVTERLMDLIIITAMAVTGLIFIFPQLVEDVRLPLIMGIIIAVVINTAIILFLNKKNWINRLAQKLAEFIRKILPGYIGKRAYSGIMSSVRSFNISIESWENRGRGSILLPLFLTVAIWINEIGRLFLIMVALGASPTLVAVMIAASFSSLSAVFLAAGSGNIVIISAVFTACGMNFDTATAAGLLSAMTSIWLSVPIGVLAMWIAVHRRKNKSVSNDLRKGGGRCLI